MYAPRTFAKPASRWTLYRTGEAYADRRRVSDDAFGKPVPEGVEHALAKHDSVPTGLDTFERNMLQISEGLKTVREAKPDAVILVGPYAPVAAILKEAQRFWMGILFF